MSIAEITVLIWAVVSFLLYCFIIYLILKQRHGPPFNASFYGLFISIGFADLLSVLYLYGIRLAPQWGWLDMGPLFHSVEFGEVLIKISTSGASYFVSNQYVGVVAVAINRFFQLVHPGSWGARMQRTAIISQWLIPTLIIFPQFSTNTVLIHNNATGIWSAKFDNEDTVKLLPSLATIFLFMIATNAIVPTLYVVMFLHVCKQKQEFPLSVTQSVKEEIRLASMAACLFVLMAAVEILAAISIVLSMQKAGVAPLFDSLTTQMLVVLSLVNPWLLLSFGETARNKCIQWICPNTTTVHPI